MNKRALMGLVVAFGLLIVLVLLVLAGGAVSNSGQSSGQMLVTASFYPLYFLVAQIGGERVLVSNLTPTGAEPHDYEPTPSELARISESQLLVLNGGGLEPWSDQLRQLLNPKQTQIIIVGEDGQLAGDPHLWLAPPLLQKMAEKVALALEQVDPRGRVYYRTNLERLKSDLDRLDQDYQRGLRNCARRDFVTAHAAFAYLAAAYNLRQLAIAGISPEAEPGAKQLAAVAQFVRSHNLQYIFFESLLSPKLAETIARETGAKTLVLNPLEGLTKAERAAGDDYFTIMRENLTNLQLALQCPN